MALGGPRVAFASGKEEPLACPVPPGGISTSFWLHSVSPLRQRLSSKQALLGRGFRHHVPSWGPDSGLIPYLFVLVLDQGEK